MRVSKIGAGDEKKVKNIGKALSSCRWVFKLIGGISGVIFTNIFNTMYAT